jgi:hypothetical protein
MAMTIAAKALAVMGWFQFKMSIRTQLSCLMPVAFTNLACSIRFRNDFEKPLMSK